MKNVHTQKPLHNAKGRSRADIKLEKKPHKQNFELELRFINFGLGFWI
jgi:hypothetical protein